MNKLIEIFKATIYQKIFHLWCYNLEITNTHVLNVWLKEINMYSTVSFYTFKNGMTKGLKGKLVASWSWVWNSSIDIVEFWIENNMYVSIKIKNNKSTNDYKKLPSKMTTAWYKRVHVCR